MTSPRGFQRDAGNGLVIRQLAQADLSQAAEMLRQLSREVAGGFEAMADEASLAEFGPFGLKRFDALVADRGDGTLAGLCLYTWAFSGWRGKAGMFMEDLYVAQDWRKSGLGRKLVRAAAECEMPNGAHFIKLELASDNHKAMAFYRKAGFVLHAEERSMILETAEMERLIKR